MWRFRCIYILIGLCFIISIASNILYDKSLKIKKGTISRLRNETNVLTSKINANDSILQHREDRDYNVYDGNQDQNKVEQTEENTDNNEAQSMNEHRLANLSCEKYGGPSDDISKEMVYWSDIPSDSSYVSPFFREDKEEKYLTFEPDGGGWNNIRMAMETVITMAHAMGRTLVMPPEHRMLLLGKTKHTKGLNQKVHFSFADFYHLNSLNAEHIGIKIIDMEEFLERTAMKGKLVDKSTGEPLFPPNNRTYWNGLAQHEKELYEYLRKVTHVRNWKPMKCLAVFSKSTDPLGIQNIETMLSDILSEKDGRKQPQVEDFIGKPTAVNAPPEERLREALAGRTELCVYDEEMQKAPVVHFMCYHKERARLLTHFYTFLFFEDWKQDLWTKRFVRDHLRYLDELQCAAARVVNAIHERARKNDPENNPNGLFDSFHVRRGDFQYKRTRIEATQIYENSKDKVKEGSTIFISTDERHQDFFSVLKDHYDVCFLSDFTHLFEELNTNYYGILDQLIASKGRVFMGTYHSTFTGFINRMRGYYIQKHKLNGFEDGTMESYYFVPLNLKNLMRTYMPMKKAFFNREFPIAWRDIDRNIIES